MKEDTNKRLYYIDFLKFLGLTGIIIAHVGAPDWLLMLRSFDVPLMVIISSLLAQKSFDKSNGSLKSISRYYISRIKRLVIPTWIFLLIYFIIKYIVTKEFLGIKYYAATFLLTRYGFGYVWIILIYLYSCMLIPVFNKMKFNWKNNLIVILIYIIYEVCYYFKLGININILETTFYYIIPYGMLTYIGYNYNKMTNKNRYALIICNILLFIGCGIYYYYSTGMIQFVQIVKYPPRIYYLSYGIFCSLLLLIVTKKYDINFFKSKIISFISLHSMWIYLWHILAIDVYETFKLPDIWYIKLLFIYTLAIIIVIIVNKALDLIEKKFKCKFFKYLRG